MPGQGGRIQVTGLKEAVKNTRQFGDKGTQDAIKKANFEAAVTLIEAALPRVPVLTGRLKTTLKPSRTLSYAAARAGSAQVPYAGPIHWGWGRKHIKPQPFFAEALGYTYEKILAKYEYDMEQALKKYELR
jgi:hypothetical protein